MVENSQRRILVVTVVHDPRDSRIWFRQIGALLAQGWSVTYAAPFSSDVAVAGPWDGWENGDKLRLVTLPRARGKSRLHAAVSARRLLRRERASHDVVLIHDPELLAALGGLRVPQLVWDVHEDTAAALGQKEWLPAPLRGPVAQMVRIAERWAEKRFTLLLAESSYQRRFRSPHAVIPNAVIVPDDVSSTARQRVVYLGSITPARGSEQLPTIGRMLRERTHGAISLEVIGPTYDDATTNLMIEATSNQELTWLGYLPADQALSRLRGALAGLSLLSDTPNFRHSMPTKVLEYCAYGVPVITSPLPCAADLVERSRCGVVVPWGNPEAVVEAVIGLSSRPGIAQDMGRRGRHLAMTEYDWARWSAVFVNELESVAERVSDART